MKKQEAQEELFSVVESLIKKKPLGENGFSWRVIDKGSKLKLEVELKVKQ